VNDLYVTEKLWDALLAWCLPIYYGGKAAYWLLPDGSFLRLPSLDAKRIAYIKEVINNLSGLARSSKSHCQSQTDYPT